MRAPRGLLPVLVVFLVIAVAALLLLAGAAVSKPAGLSSHSAAPDGALGLYLWLQSLGYRVERLEYRDFAPGDTMSALLMLAPTATPDEDELTTLYEWVADGGTLLVVGSTLPDPAESPFGNLFDTQSPLVAVLRKFGLTQHPLVESEPAVAPRQPLLRKPAVASVEARAHSYVQGPPGLVPYLGDPEQPVAAGLAVGRGKVYVLASEHALSNAGLGQADNAALLLNWLPEPGAAGIAFDEIHHGLGEERSLARLAVRRPWGWAVFYALAVVFLYLLLGRRRFGRTVPAVADGRRAAAEYVISLAGLLRRGGKREWAVRHYKQALRRQLAETCGLDPALEAPALAERLAGLGRLAGGGDGSAVGRLLVELSSSHGKGIEEGQLVRLAAETDRIIRACGGRRR